jgi:hypothetical protein
VIRRDFDSYEYKSLRLPSQIDVSICYKDFIFAPSSGPTGLDDFPIPVFNFAALVPRF